jgi:hypothetical protein
MKALRQVDGPIRIGESRIQVRNPGKQPGAPGSYLAWSQDPDRAVPHFPQGGVHVRRGPGRRGGPGDGCLAPGGGDPGDGRGGHPA